ncbi:MAG: PAS domain-containing protein [Alphaproteobacteria bacterium]|nr:PAS domain-containing protein [Alphaproteobacteria bacterium]
MKTVLELAQMPEFREVFSFVDKECALTDSQYTRIQKVHDFWEHLMVNGLASRSQIDPTALGADILPHIVLLDVLDDGTDYRWRLFGSRHEAEYGANLRGKTITEISSGNDVPMEFKGLLDAVTSEGCPKFFKISYFNSNDNIRTAVGAVMPLWDDGPIPTTLISVADWISLKETF